MNFEFEKFVETDASYDPKITVRQKTGQLGFSAGAINLYRIHDFSHVVLYFDRVSRVIGIQLSRDGSAEGSIPIAKRQSNTYINAKNFLNKYSVDYSASHRHTLKKDEETGLLYFDADKETIEEAALEKDKAAEAREMEGQEDPFAGL